MLRRLLFLLLFLALPTVVTAQTVTDQRVWFAVTLQGDAGPASPWRWSLEAFVRSRDGVDAVDSAAVRPIISYMITPHSTAGAGYALGQSFPAAGGTVLEQRVFGQYIWTRPMAGGSLALRTRVEARFIEGNSGPLARLRQQVRVVRPLTRGSRLSIVGSDELLVHLNTTSRNARGVDQNRLFVGIAHALTRALRVEVGYLNQFIPGHGGPNRMNHVLSGALSASF